MAGELKLEYKRLGRNGKARLTARLPDGTSYTDKFDVASAKDRDRFLRGLCKGRRGIDRKAMAAELDRIAGAVVGRPDEGGEGDKDDGRVSQADQLVDLITGMEGVELFHTPGGNDSEPYATVPVDAHRETWLINSRGFRRWLGQIFYERFDKVPGSQALQDALTVIAGKAIHEGAEHAVAVRVAERDGALWLDLADEEWRAVRVTRDGWKIVADSPVRFLRRRGMLPLPFPVRGGTIEELHPFVNLPDDGAWRLFVSWLIAALRPDRPFPILTVNGEQGSAKSTLARIARKLIDPNIAPLRRPPREVRDVMIAASNGWIVAYDNLSSLSADLSDVLCCLATGGGFGTRELYTDADERLFDAMRPVIINGIEDIATRPDLLDRSLSLTLPAIADEQRRDEEQLWRRFDEARPRILGAILDSVSAALGNKAGVMLASKPRMADFATWVVAAQPALGWPPGAFLHAYNQNRGAANALTLESAIIAPPILSLMSGQQTWHGTLKELLAELEARHTDEKTRTRKEWPASARKLSGELRRLAPNLRRAGLHVTFGEHTRAGTPVTVESVGNVPSLPSPLSPTRQDKDGLRDGSRDCGGLSGQPSPCNPLRDNFGDDGDGGDGVLRACSDAPDSADEVVEWTA